MIHEDLVPLVVEEASLKNRDCGPLVYLVTTLTLCERR
jgi:hypothetical protein